MKRSVASLRKHFPRSILVSLLLFAGACSSQQGERERPQESTPPATTDSRPQPQTKPPAPSTEPIPAEEKKEPPPLAEVVEKEPPGILVSQPEAKKDKRDPKESLDRVAAGNLPASWKRWSSGGASFQVAAGKAVSDPNALGVTAGSSGAARAWLDERLPADVQAGAAVLLDTLI